MRNDLLGKLTPFKNKSVLITQYQQTDDIIDELLKGHEKYKKDYDNISDQFWRGNLKDSCKYVFNYLKNNVRYNIEPDTRQSIKSPAAIFATGHGDCKHYSSVFGGLLDSWSRKKFAGKPINWCYRFANYKLFNSQPHHVFCVVKLGNSEMWCDAVLSSFDNHKPYINKIDKKPKNNMALYHISGIGCKDCGGSCGVNYNDGFGAFGMPEISGRRTKAERKARRVEKRTARRSGENCKGRTGAKIAPPLILARNGFLLLVKVNFRSLATRLDAALKTPNATKIFEKWCGFGGNAKTLKIAISQGKRKKRLGSVGSLTAAITAAWASAQPIILAITPILAAAAKFLPAGSKGKEVLETASEVAEQVTESSEQSGGGETTAGISNNFIYGGLALAGIYLLTRKK